MQYDVTVIGAGIVGLSTAYKLALAQPDLRILVLEKESGVAAHQTGNNSGVIHSGIYYKPGSYKAKNCVDGRRELVRFCRDHNIKHDVCGKIIVATEAAEVPRLKAIYERGKQNQIEGIRMIDVGEMHELEPYAAGVKAIHVPCAGIVDFHAVCETLRSLLVKHGTNVRFEEKVTSISQDNEGLHIAASSTVFKSRWLINCAGLHSDKVAEAAGLIPPVRIVPFRGEYFDLTPEAEHKVRNLIYPMPNPEFPFLGVHFTRMANGGIECGPNAVFAFKREGYTKTAFDVGDAAETLAYRGFWKMAGRHWKMGLDELYRSFSRTAFLKNLQTLVPSLTDAEIRPAPSGVRAMALTPNGDIVDDFMILRHGREVHVLNAPSPAATAGLSLGRQIANTALVHFGYENENDATRIMTA
jgi:(S)-2-hydroxyglutarate dehydrogenase